MNAPRETVMDAAILDLAADFPILARPVHRRRLAYLDNGATTQKPAAVIDAEARFYRESNANIHRGVHWLSQHATELYDGARATVQRFLNAASADEIVFTRGTTEAINLVAQSWGRPRLSAGDEILLSTMEHHSNIVPWQLLCEQTGAVLKVIPVLDNGELDMVAFEGLIGERTRLLAITHVSNALGTVNPVAEMTRRAHELGAVVFRYGLWIALPMIGMLMFVNTVLGFISRVAPQMNAFAIGFPLTLSVGLVGIAFTLPMLGTPVAALLKLATDLFMGG